MAFVPSVRRFLISSILLSFCLQLAAGVTQKKISVSMQLAEESPRITIRKLM